MVNDYGSDLCWVFVLEGKGPEQALLENEEGLAKQRCILFSRG